MFIDFIYHHGKLQMGFHQTHRLITLNFFCKALSYDLSVENLNKIFVLPDFFFHVD